LGADGSTVMRKGSGANASQDQISGHEPNQRQMRPSQRKQDQISPNNKEAESLDFKGLRGVVGRIRRSLPAK